MCGKLASKNFVTVVIRLIRVALSLVVDRLLQSLSLFKIVSAIGVVKSS